MSVLLALWELNLASSLEGGKMAGMETLRERAGREEGSWGMGGRSNLRGGGVSVNRC